MKLGTHCWNFSTPSGMPDRDPVEFTGVFVERVLPKLGTIG